MEAAMSTSVSAEEAQQLLKSMADIARQASEAFCQRDGQVDEITESAANALEVAYDNIYGEE